ncbi:sensor histidine kinase [Saccharomonospora sp. NPDC006951]
MPTALPSATRDIAFSAVIAVVIAGTTVAYLPFDDGEFSVWSWVLLIVASGALAMRNRHPVAVGIVTLAVVCVYYVFVGPDGPILLTFVIALYSTAKQGRLLAAIVLGALAGIATAYGEIVSNGEHLGDVGLVMLLSWLVAAIAFGHARRNSLALLRETGQRAATEERLRIARELHDSLGHHLSIINVQAGAALHRFDADPEQGRTALGLVKAESKQTLRELRATLGVLRSPTEQGPGLDQLDLLVEQARSTGLSVVTEVAGERRPLPPDADLAAYRVVQEALTNVGRHAAASTATVRIRYLAGELKIEVADDGEGGKGEPGNGLTGMGERVKALGGDLSVGSGKAGGFSVTARLPQGAGA